MVFELKNASKYLGIAKFVDEQQYPTRVCWGVPIASLLGPE